MSNRLHNVIPAAVSRGIMTLDRQSLDVIMAVEAALDEEERAARQRGPADATGAAAGVGVRETTTAD